MGCVLYMKTHMHHADVWCEVWQTKISTYPEIGPYVEIMCLEKDWRSPLIVDEENIANNAHPLASRSRTRTAVIQFNMPTY